MTIDRRAMVRINRGMGVLSLLIGLVLVGGAARVTLRYRAFIARAVATPGRVVENVPTTFTTTSTVGSLPQRHTSYCAVVEYVSRAGETRRYKDNDICFNPPSFRIGQIVTVRMDPTDSTSVHIDHGNRVYFVPLAVAIVGVLALLGGAQRLAGRGLREVVPEQDVPIIPSAPSSAAYRNV